MSSSNKKNWLTGGVFYSGRLVKSKIILLNIKVLNLKVEESRKTQFFDIFGNIWQHFNSTLKWNLIDIEIKKVFFLKVFNLILGDSFEIQSLALAIRF